MVVVLGGGLSLWAVLMGVHFAAYQRWRGNDRRRHSWWVLGSVLESALHTVLGAMLVLGWSAGLLWGFVSTAAVLGLNVAWAWDHRDRVARAVAQGDRSLRLWILYAVYAVVYTGWAAGLLLVSRVVPMSVDVRLASVWGAISLAHVAFNVCLYDWSVPVAPPGSSGH